MKQFGCYIHIPFCATKCHYCDFNSFALQKSEHLPYLNTLIKHLTREAEKLNKTSSPFTSLFIGGGTPTIYQSFDLCRLVDSTLTTLNFSAQPEVTLESNPNSITTNKLRNCRDAGVNRLSIGIQSFDDQLLRVLGRSHNVKQALAAFRQARQAGFSNINLDLMYGLPGQTLKTWQKTLKTAVALNPEHLACYELTIEQGTPFGQKIRSGELTLPGEEEILAMEELTHQTLATHTYQRYEISNFGQKGYFCRHNINYWQNGEYLGIGAGAVSYITGLRLKNLESPANYCAQVIANGKPYLEGEALNHTASFRESIIMGLRMLDGVNLTTLKQQYSLDPLIYYGKILQRLLDRGLVEHTTNQLKLSAKALPVANQVLAELV